jgi:hypothetical protein
VTQPVLHLNAEELYIARRDVALRTRGPAPVINQAVADFVSARRTLGLQRADRNAAVLAAAGEW